MPPAITALINRAPRLVTPLVLSSLLHAAALVLVALHMNQPARIAPLDALPIAVVDLAEPVAPAARVPAEIRTAAAEPQADKIKTIKPAPQIDAPRADRSAPPPTVNKTEAAKASEASEAHAPRAEPSSAAHYARSEGGGSEAGAGKLFSKGEVGVALGSGSAGAGGTAAAGLGRSAGAPGLPAPGAPLRTNREAKPVQTARAAYPAMALRAGLEADVMLKIEVDPQGNVTKAEIAKSGGAGFDEEALKAVKQSRFEPAQRDGQNVPAEFTYVYKFRLQR